MYLYRLFKVAKRLPIQGAYHTILMMPVKQELEKALARVEIGVPRYNVYSNFTGKVYPRREKDIKKCIYSLISNPVKWEQILQLLYRKHQVGIIKVEYTHYWRYINKQVRKYCHEMSLLKRILR